ncbi:MAG: hypothetical protein NTZ21_13950 [Actinobacteria bacterium]|nr:hypothetical protein [Actinomycetota bacterium]
MNVMSAVADVIAVPRQEPADSFVLHAPLELLARTALLPTVRADRRETAMRRITEMVDEFEGFGDPVAPPEVVSPESVVAAAAALVGAVDAGDLDGVDAYSTWIGDHVAAADLPALLADAVIPRLSAAGHAPIFLWLYPRVAPNRELTGRLLRQLCRELARRPDWRIGWIDEAVDDAAPADVDLFAILADAPRLGRPSSTFIHPLMSRVDVPDLAPRLLTPLLQATPDEVAAHGAALTRLAAWSMLAEPTDDAPYGWSHCLTMPQAVLGVADACASPARALAVAATHVLGFRASLARSPLDRSIAESWSPVDLPFEQAIAAGPEVARAALWHLPESAFDEATTTLATVAATHHDAHLVKYTLACLDAAALDPSARRLYLAAAATLAGWWAVAQSP